MISDVIGWKFNHQPGMRCEEIGGVMTIVEFPGGIPSLEDQALWTQEYNNWLLSGGDKDAEAEQIMASPLGLAMMEEFIQILNDNNLNVPLGVVDNIKTRIKTKL